VPKWTRWDNVIKKLYGRNPLTTAKTNPQLAAEQIAFACPVCHVVFTPQQFLEHTCDPRDIIKYGGV
jgi:hypothetical protein